MADSIYPGIGRTALSPSTLTNTFLRLRVPSSASYRNTSEQRDERCLLPHEEDGPGSICCFQVCRPIFFSSVLVTGFLCSVRVDGVVRSSLYSHFSESLSSLATIRAYSETKRFRSDNEMFVDVENRVYRLTVVNQGRFLLEKRHCRDHSFLFSNGSESGLISLEQS